MCGRCKTAGFDCDFEKLPESNAVLNHVTSNPRKLLAAPRVAPSPFREIATWNHHFNIVGGSFRDRLSFHYFCSLAIGPGDATGYSKFDRPMLQMALREPKIWHCVQVLASLYYSAIDKKIGEPLQLSKEIALQLSLIHI